MKWPLILFLFFGSELRANIYLRSQSVSPEQFREIVQKKGGQALSSWLAQKDLGQSQTDDLLQLGEKFLSSEMKLNPFLTEINLLTNRQMPTGEWRQALIDILLKKDEINQKESPEIWEQICYFYHLDEKIQELWPQFYQRCKLEKPILSLAKPSFLKNDLVYVDGVEWKNKISFFPRRASNPLAMQIKIYSDSEIPLQLKAQTLSLDSLTKIPLLQGECGKMSFFSEPLSAYEVPLLQVFSVSTPSCIEPVLRGPNLESSSFWKKHRQWIWLAGILAGGLLIHELKDKEVSFEWP